MKAGVFLQAVGVWLASLLVSSGDSGTGEGNGPVSPAQLPEGRTLQAKVTPEEFPDAFLRGEYERIYAQTSEGFRKAVTLDEVARLAVPFNQGVTEYRLQTAVPLGEFTEYIWLDSSGQKALAAYFDRNGTIGGMEMRMLERFPRTDRVYTKQEYAFPIRETWWVFWGGDHALVNYHYPYENQRYAYDLVIVKDGSTYAGDPDRNESYHAFGREVVAPADGVVARVRDGVPDNHPVGARNERQPEGNYVVIDHGGGEYSMVAHLKRGSIRVKKGDAVKRGQVIGLCGNSGNSSEPHLHFQVQDSPDPQTGRSIRIRLQGEREPVRGDFVQP